MCSRSSRSAAPSPPTTGAATGTSSGSPNFVARAELHLTLIETARAAIERRGQRDVWRIGNGAKLRVAIFAADRPVIADGPFRAAAHCPAEPSRPLQTVCGVADICGRVIIAGRPRGGGRKVRLRSEMADGETSGHVRQQSPEGVAGATAHRTLNVGLHHRDERSSVGVHVGCAEVLAPHQSRAVDGGLDTEHQIALELPVVAGVGAKDHALRVMR